MPALHDHFSTQPRRPANASINPTRRGSLRRSHVPDIEYQSRGSDPTPDSEANEVIDSFKRLTVQDQQDLLNFLRSL